MAGFEASSLTGELEGAMAALAGPEAGGDDESPSQGSRAMRRFDQPR
jgi:hypothetical protein